MKQADSHSTPLERLLLKVESTWSVMILCLILMNFGSFGALLLLCLALPFFDSIKQLSSLSQSEFLQIGVEGSLLNLLISFWVCFSVILWHSLQLSELLAFAEQSSHSSQSSQSIEFILFMVASAMLLLFTLVLSAFAVIYAESFSSRGVRAGSTLQLN